MPSTYSNLKIELIALGEQDSTWGLTTNVNLGTAIEEAIAGTANPVMGDSNLTLTLVDSNVSQVARHYILNVTSSVTLTETRDLIVPAISKPYIVRNNTTGTQSIVVKTATGSGVTIPNGKTVMVVTTSAGVVPAFNDLPQGTSIGGGGDVVGATNTQTLTNKTIAFGSNTLTDVASTNTTQTLTNKTIAFGSNTLTDVASTNTTQTLTNKTIAFGSNTLIGVAPLASPTFTGAIDMTGSQRGGITAVAALDINCSLGNYFTKTINANSTFTFSSAPASRSYSFTLELTHTSGTVTWPAAVRWPYNIAPSLTTGKTHLFMFVTDDGGTSWRGASLVDYDN